MSPVDSQDIKIVPYTGMWSQRETPTPGTYYSLFAHCACTTRFRPVYSSCWFKILVVHDCSPFVRNIRISLRLSL